MEPSIKHVAQPSASPFSGSSSNQSSNSNLNNSRPGSYDQSFRPGGQLGSGPSTGNQNNSHVMFNQQQQQQQQRQQQHNHMNFMNRLPSASESDFGLYGGFGINKLSSGSTVSGQNPVQAMSLQQQQQRQQFAYSQRMFGFGTPEPEPKKKRGRPRKNETKEPGTKRAYKRRPKNVDSGPQVPVSDVSHSVQQPLGTMNQPLSRGPIPGMTGNRPHQQMGSVYNFEDEEANEDLGSILPRRLTGSTQSTKQKYSFGSSSDEEIPRPPQGAVHQQNLLPGSRPTQGNGPFQNYHFPHSGMGGIHTNQIMSGMHQKNSMGIGTIGGIGAIRGTGTMQQSISNRPMVNQHQMIAQQSKPPESLQMSEEDCRYSSEILEKDKGIGIKIKIKKAGDSSNSSANSSLQVSHQQELQHQNQHQAQNCMQDQQKQQSDLKDSNMSLGERLHVNERISSSSHVITSQSQPSISSLSHVQQLSPSVASGHPFMGKNVNPHIQSQQSQHLQQNQQHHSTVSSPSTMTNQNASGYSSPHGSSNFSHTNTHIQNQTSYTNHGVVHANGLQQSLHQHPQQQLHHQHSNMQQSNALVGIGQRPGMANGHPNSTPPLRSPFNSSPSPSHQPHFGQQMHQPNTLSHSYRFIGQNQVNSPAMAGSPSPLLNHQQNQTVLNQKAMIHQQGQVMNNFYYNQGMNNSFNMQSQQNQYQQGSFPVGNMAMGGPTFNGSGQYRYGTPHNGAGYNGYTNQYGMMNVSGQNASGQFQDQQFNNQFNCHQQFGNNMMFASSNGMTSGGPVFGNRMGGNNELMSQPVPPNFRHQQQMMQQQPIMNQLSHGSMMGNVMNTLPHMGGSIGQPRISPSSMHKPMPGVGLVSPSIPSRQQPTPLVSPQSLHSMSEHSPASSMHNQPLTPGNNFGGPTTPQSCNPMTPMGIGMTSPMTPVAQNQIHANVNPSSIGFQQNMMSPLSSDDLNALRSPSGCASSSNLRKVRRPSKAFKESEPVTPKPDYEEDNISTDRLGDFGDLVKEEERCFGSNRVSRQID
jgi:hypothetical protein